jgi:glucose/mannose-6-phosphate isomerase
MDLFLKNILEFNRQLTPEGLQSFNLKRLKRRSYDSVIIAGMGGSGLAGELLKDVREEIGLPVPVFTWKEYALPKPETFGAKKPLYIFVSFSGNTEETLSGFKAAIKEKGFKLQACSIAAVTHGGELGRLAARFQIPYILFPASSLNPRQYTGRMFYSLIQILRAAHLIPLEPPAYTRLKPLRFKSEGINLAQRLRNKVVLIYTERENYGLGYIWKSKLNETAKQLAFLNIVPEMNHNELEGLVFPKVKLAALFISDASGAAKGQRLRKRIRVNFKLLRKMGIESRALKLTGKSRLEKTWNSVMLADWTAYYLAKLNRVNPAEVKIVEELKELMNK